MTLLKEHPPDPAHQTATVPSEITMKSEIVRKMIHLCSITIPVLYVFLTREQMLWLLLPLTLISITLEVLRFTTPSVEAVLRRFFDPIMRQHEKAGGKAKISGATWVLVSAAICVLLFPKVVVVAGFTVLIVSDTAAALFGRRFGRHKFLEKSVEGSSAFVVTAILVVLVVMLIFNAPISFLWAGIAASIAAAVAEALSYGVNIDDNLTIPTSFGVVMWGLLALIGGPEVERLWEFGRGVI